MVEWDGAFTGQLRPGKKPALLLVDPVNAYLDSQSPLYLESGTAALEAMHTLLTQFRKHSLPVAFTGVRYQTGGADGGHFFKKVPALEVFVGESTLGAIPELLEPSDGEGVFIKQYPSAFFGTNLDVWLKGQGVDTLVIGGFSTSGCVRASALDAMQLGYVPIVVADACADRSIETHTQNLADLGAKYSEIVSLLEASKIIKSA